MKNIQSLIAKSKIIKTAKRYAVQCARMTNHKYGNKPYSCHLGMVFEVGVQYAYLLPEEDVEYVLASLWPHDSIEDHRQTYNDVLKACGKLIADIAYALTNEKGKDRSERANAKYYKGIRDTKYADYAKMCDRIANAKESAATKSKMLATYKEELADGFLKKIGLKKEFQPMADELINILK